MQIIYDLFYKSTFKSFLLPHIKKFSKPLQSVKNDLYLFIYKVKRPSVRWYGNKIFFKYFNLKIIYFTSVIGLIVLPHNCP